MNQIDASYRQVFGTHAIVRDLLRLPWLEHVARLLDLSSLTPMPTALRMMSYRALLYENLRCAAYKRKPLPALIPVVLYSGSRRWKAMRDVRRLIEPVHESLEIFQPKLEYLLVDERDVVQSTAAPESQLDTLRAAVSGITQEPRHQPIAHAEFYGDRRHADRHKTSLVPTVAGRRPR